MQWLEVNARVLNAVFDSNVHFFNMHRKKAKPEFIVKNRWNWGPFEANHLENCLMNFLFETIESTINEKSISVANKTTSAVKKLSRGKMEFIKDARNLHT